MVKAILVTGSTGWLGGKLCEALVARGVKVVGLARRVTKIAGVLSVRADLATGAGLEKLKDFEFDCCVHLAAVAGWGALADCLEVNVQGTRRLFDALAPYEQPGHERDALYDNSLVREELGFVPKVNVLTAYQA